MLISWLIFYFFQLNRYVTLHGIQHISAHRHNQEPPPPQFSLLQQREAATESPGKNPPSFHFFTILISWLTFLFFHFNQYVTIHGIQHISAHRHNQELPPAQFSLLQQGEATTASPGQNPLSYHFFTMLISQLIFYFFQLNRYVTLHGIQHISAHRHNQEPPPAQFSSRQQREAATASPGKNPLSFRVFTMKILLLTFLFFSIELLCHTPRDPIHLGPQTQPRADTSTDTFAAAERSSDRKPR
jgi:ssRNA-specific RNase YbeY (16S rRNA maturation enzyme)